MFGLNLNWLLAHFIGDFVIQNDWMASNKKKSNMACFIHASTYIIPYFFTALTPLQVMLIGLQHYAQDRTYFVAWFCGITKKFQQPHNSFWGHVIVDNVFHIIWILLVIKYL